MNLFLIINVYDQTSHHTYFYGAPTITSFLYSRAVITSYSKMNLLTIAARLNFKY